MLKPSPSPSFLNDVFSKTVRLLLYLAGPRFGCGMQNHFSCHMWDLVPWPESKPRPPALGARSLSHWTTKEVPHLEYFYVYTSVWFIAFCHIQYFTRLHVRGMVISCDKVFICSEYLKLKITLLFKSLVEFSILYNHPSMCACVC